jgi:hypothetical protein
MSRGRKPVKDFEPDTLWEGLEGWDSAWDNEPGTLLKAGETLNLSLCLVRARHRHILKLSPCGGWFGEM